MLPGGVLAVIQDALVTYTHFFLPRESPVHWRGEAQPEGEAMNPLLELRQKGQSVWLDYIQRSLITSGGLLSLIENDGVRGVTSNPSIFEKAIDTDADYDGALAELLARKPAITAQELYDVVVLEDVHNATDILRP